MSRDCIRITPTVAKDFARLANAMADALKKNAEELDAITSVEDSHDPTERFIGTLVKISMSVDSLAPILAMLKATGGILGGTEDQKNGLIPDDYHELGKRQEKEPFDMLRDLMNKETQDYPQAEA